MLIRQRDLARIATGEVTLAFRRWKRPTVKAGGTLRTQIGLLAIDAVDEVSLSKITKADARRAGFASREELVDELEKRTGSIVRIRLRPSEQRDERAELARNGLVDKADLDEIEARLDRFDRASRQGAWTRSTLASIANSPGRRAADLAAEVGVDKAWFKGNVRKLKALGLTESLEIGYRLTPRGRAWMKRSSS